MTDLALVYQSQGRWRQAEELEASVVNLRTRMLGPGHPDTLTGTSNLASIYRDQGKYEAAEAMARRDLEGREAYWEQSIQTH